MKYHTIIGDETYVIEINGEHDVMLNGEPVDLDFTTINDQGLYSLIISERSFEAQVDRVDLANWEVFMSGNLYEVEIYEESVRLLQQKTGAGAAGDGDVKAPMPGLVLSVPVDEGDVIEQGDKVVILESMKMENELKAPRGGIVSKVNVQAGDSVKQNQVLIVIE